MIRGRRIGRMSLDARKTRTKSSNRPMDTHTDMVDLMIVNVGETPQGPVRNEQEQREGQQQFTAMVTATTTHFCVCVEFTREFCVCVIFPGDKR